MTYSEVQSRAESLAAGFSKNGISVGEKIAFMLPNCPDWAILDLACARIGVINAPIHTTYGPEYIKHIVNDSEARWLVIHKEFWDRFKFELSDLKVERVVVVGEDGDFAELFLKEDAPKVDILPQDPHTIIYTSGTTGKPKGVLLTNKNLVTDAFCAKEYVPVDENDSFLSFLPLSHALERTAGHYVPLFSGSCIYYAQSKLTLKDDIKIAQPTILVSVPRIFEKVYDGIWDKVRAGSSLKQKLFYSALDLGTKKRKNELSFFDNIFYKALDAIVLKKIRAALGGNLKFAVSGGSSLSPDIMQFFQDIGILIIEGYGLTETSPIIAVNKPDNCKIGTVGEVVTSAEVEISEDGEVMVRGDIVTSGYYKNDQATKESFTQDGWFKTGDLGKLDQDGFLSIVGRKKEIIVLSTGRNVAPVPIEQELETNKYIYQAFVYGDNQNHISAVLIPDFEELKIWAEQNGVVYEFPEIIKRKDVLELFEKQIDAQMNHFPENEKVREFVLSEKEFTQENDMLTPTLKLKRKNIMEKYVKKYD